MSDQSLDQAALDPTARGTLAYYEGRAEEFRAGTQDHDVSQNIEALLRHIRAKPPFTILDFGCGPGRDLAAFRTLGHIAIGLEGATPFVTMARSAGSEVLELEGSAHLGTSRAGARYALRPVLHPRSYRPTALSLGEVRLPTLPGFGLRRRGRQSVP